MAQGFKPSKAGTSKGPKGKQRAGPRPGAKVIAPKKKPAVDAANRKRKQTAALTQKIESEMAGRASGGGPLTIMKKLGNEVTAQKEKERERKLASQKAKGRA